MTLPDPDSFIAQGASAQVYRMGEGRVLKLFRDGVDPVTIEREYAVAQAVADAGLPVPQVFGMAQAGGRQGIIYSEISGPTLLGHVIRHRGEWRWALDEMARVQQQIASCALPDMRRRKGIMADDIVRAPINADLRDAAMERLAQCEDGGSLTHGDLHPGNVIVSADGLVVIDWARAASGVAMSDVLRTEMVMRFGTGHQPFRGEAVARDIGAAYYIWAYRRMTTLDRAAMKLWRPLVALAWMRHRLPAREAKFHAYLGKALRVAGLPPLR